jgi:hypothetical protein
MSPQGSSLPPSSLGKPVLVEPCWLDEGRAGSEEGVEEDAGGEEEGDDELEGGCVGLLALGQPLSNNTQPISSRAFVT